MPAWTATDALPPSREVRTLLDGSDQTGLFEILEVGHEVNVGERELAAGEVGRASERVIRGVERALHFRAPALDGKPIDLTADETD